MANNILNQTKHHVSQQFSPAFLGCCQDPHWRGRHTYPFDMYSLGVILFELCAYFATGMERIVALADLRRGLLPDGFADTWPDQARLIKWLMHPDHARRPTARALMQNAIIPARLEDEALRDAMRELSQPHSPFFAQVGLGGRR